METTYTITNDHYSNNADRVTLAQLRAMCDEMGWDVTLTVRGNAIIDQKGETVAIAV